MQLCCSSTLELTLIFMDKVVQLGQELGPLLDPITLTILSGCLFIMDCKTLMDTCMSGIDHEILSFNVIVCAFIAPSEVDWSSWGCSHCHAVYL